MYNNLLFFAVELLERSEDEERTRDPRNHEMPEWLLHSEDLEDWRTTQNIKRPDTFCRAFRFVGRTEEARERAVRGVAMLGDKAIKEDLSEEDEEMQAALRAIQRSS